MASGAHQHLEGDAEYAGEHQHPDHEAALLQLKEKEEELTDRVRSAEARVQSLEHQLNLLKDRMNRAEVDITRRAEEFHDHGTHTHDEYAERYHSH